MLNESRTIQGPQGIVSFSLHGDAAKKPLLLLHGLPLDHRVWSGVLADLGKEFFAIAPDVPPFGGSEEAKGQPFFACADTARQLLASLGVESAIVVGHSFGGYVACDFLARFPQSISALGLLTSKPGTDSPNKIEERLAAADALEQRDYSEYRKSQVTFAGRAAAMRCDGELLSEIISENVNFRLAGLLRALTKRPDYSRALRGCEVPLFLLAAEADPAFRPAMHALHAESPRADFTVHPTSGHMVMVEDPSFVANWIRRLAKQIL